VCEQDALRITRKPSRYRGLVTLIYCLACKAGLDAIHQELSPFRYCTVFVVEGEELDAEALETQLERLTGLQVGAVEVHIQDVRRSA